MAEYFNFIEMQDDDVIPSTQDNIRYVYAYVKYKTETGEEKTKKVKCWYNNFLGNQMINAVSGSPMGACVGSCEEANYYKIKHCGFIDKPVSLYYNTRQEAEKHLGLNTKMMVTK